VPWSHQWLQLVVQYETYLWTDFGHMR